MHGLTNLEFVLAGVAAVTALQLAVVLVDFIKGHRTLRSLANYPPQRSGPAVSIVVAARNEARRIEEAITSLTRLDYQPLEIIVVNDRSTDGTGEILHRLAARFPQLAIVDVSTLPDGWLGKNHALFVGASRASGDLILFTDADVIFEPTTLGRAVAALERERLDHLAAIPEVAVPGIALNAFVAAFGVFLSLYARPWKVRDPASPHHIGIGAFNLLRAGAYIAAGTHRAIAMRPDDDIKLGKLVKKAGLRQDVVYATEHITVEWYTSMGQLVDGLMKNAFAGANYSLWAVLGATVGLCLTLVWPLVAVVVTHGVVRLLNLLDVVLAAAIFWTSVRRAGARVAYVVAFPFAALLFAYIIWRSALLAVATGTIRWRGTAYPLAEMRANRV